MKRMFCLIALAALCGSGCSTDFVFRSDGAWVYIDGTAYRLEKEPAAEGGGYVAAGRTHVEHVILWRRLEGRPGIYVNVNGKMYRVENL